MFRHSTFSKIIAVSHSTRNSLLSYQEIRYPGTQPGSLAGILVPVG